MSNNWSPLQLAIFEVIANGSGNIFVSAVAGSGKTTTIVEATKRVPNGLTRIFLAFNKAIADELKSRGVFAKTFHSMCIGPVARYLGGGEVDTRKMVRLATALQIPFAYRGFVRKLVGLGKQVGVDCAGMLPNSRETWLGIIKHHQVELESEFATIERAVEYAQELLDASNADPAYDFDDMLYYVVKHNLALEQYDFVFVDEAQDTNMMQREILRKMLKPTSRMVAVGDEHQAIYGFRGADSTAIATLCREFACETFPLSVTYRCARAITQYAQQWVPHIEARADAPQGVVKALESWAVDMFKPGDLILSRTARGVLSIGMKLIRNQIPVQIMGKEIGEGMMALVKKMASEDLDVVSTRLVEWRDREMTKLLNAEDEGGAQGVQDRADAVLAIIDGLDEGMRTIAQVKSVIDYLFDPKAKSVRISTIHKAKGLEAPRVYWLGRKQCPSKWAKTKWQYQQELNLCYVATTRAQDELYFIEDNSSSSAGRRTSAHES